MLRRVAYTLLLGLPPLLCGSCFREDGAIYTPSGDAVQLEFSTYLGGSNWEHARDVFVDSQGYIYVVGGTGSRDFPTTSGAYDRTHESGPGTGCSACPSDAFVTKWDPHGSLIWSTLLGGPQYDRAYGVEVDGQGYVYVTGRAGPGFPTTAGAFQPNFSGVDAGIYGMENCFLAKLSPDGSNLAWASYVGVGSMCRDIAIDGSGDVYVPLTYDGVGGDPPAEWFSHAYQSSRKGKRECGVVKIRNDGSKVLWASWLGGSDDDSGAASIRVDAGGHVYLLLTTFSSDIPTTAGAYDRSYNGGGDAYLARFSPDGSSLLFATYVGGAGAEWINTHNLAVDDYGNSFLSVPAGADFPTTKGSFQSTHAGGTNDLAIAKFSPTGALNASTFIGGSGDENPDGLYTDSHGDLVITGETGSSDFPVSADAYQRNNGGQHDAVLIVMSSDLSSLLYSTYMGGASYDAGRSGFVDSNGNLHVTGSTSGTGWPTRKAYQDYFAGGPASCQQGACSGDAILAKLSPPARQPLK